MRKIFLLVVLLATSARASIQTSPVVLISDEMPQASRWMFDPEAKKPKLSPKLNLLAQMREKQNEDDFVGCVKLAPLAAQGSPQLAPWVANASFNCATGGLKNNKLKADALKALLAMVRKHPEWLVTGAARVPLKRNFLRAWLMFIDAESKSHRSEAWVEIEKLSAYASELSVDEKAELYRLAGEILFVEQKLEAAQSYFERSLALKPSALLRTRLSAFKTHGDKDGEVKSEKVATLEASADELELVNRMTMAFKAGDLLSGIEDASKMGRKYPGSARKTWAVERVLESYFQILTKSDKQFLEIEARFANQMLKFDGETQFEWAKKLFARGYYAQAFKLAEAALPSFEGRATSTAVLFLAARAALFSDQAANAETYFQVLVDQHAGSSESLEALFRLGLMAYRKQAFSRASALFERLLVLPKSENWELSARYWLWRSLEHENPGRANEQQNVLVQKFPFSYYGLRAQAETTHALDFEWKPQKRSVKIWLTAPEKETLKRVDSLLLAGWFEEATLELTTLPPATTPSAKAAMALYFARAMDFTRSTQLINEAWDVDPTIRNPPFLEASFPLEFSAPIAKEAKKQNLNPLLVRSLIKQESAFGLKATSSSGALGLMQLIPPTAQEVADQLGIKNLRLPETLFQFETNIRMGTKYLSSMLDRYDQNVPLALAAYNAGPTRLERWLNARPGFAQIKVKMSSAPEDEVWIDELPWSETRIYVKAILRNCLLYRALEKGRVALSEPLWKEMVEARLSSRPPPR